MAAAPPFGRSRRSIKFFKVALLFPSRKTRGRKETCCSNFPFFSAGDLRAMAAVCFTFFHFLLPFEICLSLPDGVLSPVAKNGQLSDWQLLFYINKKQSVKSHTRIYIFPIWYVGPSWNAFPINSWKSPCTWPHFPHVLSKKLKDKKSIFSASGVKNGVGIGGLSSFHSSIKGKWWGSFSFLAPTFLPWGTRES